jgi:hypothetical protein
MHLHRPSDRCLSFTVLLLAPVAAAATVAWPGTAQAERPGAAQICTLGFADVGQAGTVICKSTVTGATTQAIPVGATVSAAGSIGGSLASGDGHVLVTNQVRGALAFREVDGRLTSPQVLDTDGEGSLSGAVSRRGAYVLTGTHLRFFRHGETVASSSKALLLGDGSAAEVTLGNRYAYVSEKNGSLEAFLIGRDGNLVADPTPVTGISAGVIVGISGYEEGVIAPIAHLASSPDQAEIAVAEGTSRVQTVPTKEIAACWTANDDDEACVSNPGSMTVSCGRLGRDGFETYTSAAASPGESVFDLDLRGGLVGIQAVHAGAPVFLTYARTSGDFLTLVSEVPIGTAKAAGALLLPPVSR